MFQGRIKSIKSVFTLSCTQSLPNTPKLLSQKAFTFKRLSECKLRKLNSKKFLHSTERVRFLVLRIHGAADSWRCPVTYRVRHSVWMFGSVIRRKFHLIFRMPIKFAVQIKRIQFCLLLIVRAIKIANRCALSQWCLIATVLSSFKSMVQYGDRTVGSHCRIAT